MPKNLFSDQADSYAKYRPTSPQEMFEYIFQFVKEKNCAWDSATGNGQAAKILADFFKKVEASDISEEQLNKAVKKSNIRYTMCEAEHTPFANDSFDLITVATAYHWLNWKNFHTEATRVGNNNCVIAIWSYNLMRCNDVGVTKIIHHFYNGIVKAYWDPERKYVENSYKTVDFNFDPLPSKNFENHLHWTKEQFKGYLESWSAVQTYIKKNGVSPIDLIQKDIDTVWNEDEKKEICFPLFLRIGRITK